MESNSKHAANEAHFCGRLGAAELLDGKQPLREILRGGRKKSR